MKGVHRQEKKETSILLNDIDSIILFFVPMLVME